VVGLLLQHLGQLADDEHAGVADAVGADQANVVVARRDGRVDGDGELADLGLGRVLLLGALLGLWVDLDRGRGGGGGLEAGVGEEQVLGLVEVGAGEGDFHGGADLAAAGGDGGQARGGVLAAQLGLRRGGGGQQRGEERRGGCVGRDPPGGNPVPLHGCL